jgi:hypothetical protein
LCHLQANFTDRRFPALVLEKFVGGDESRCFHEIFLDFFWSPSSWTESRWPRSFFASILPRLSAEDILAHDGAVYLPFSAYIFKCVMAYQKQLLAEYSISFVLEEEFDLLVFVQATVDCEETGGKSPQEAVKQYSTTDLHKLEQQADEKIVVEQLKKYFKKLPNAANVRLVKLTRQSSQSERKVDWRS